MGEDFDACVDEETALAFLAGGLSTLEMQRVEEHADLCSACRTFLSTLAEVASRSPPAPVSPVAPTEMGDTPSPVAGVPLFTRGDAIGRYVVLAQVGVGGMGVVYAAYDPELDRKVALKLLRKLRGGREVARARLIREAQALARLTHPNVVAVYDAGAFEDQVFLAMEFAEGGTVSEWLKSERRSWREVRDTYLSAGRGLSAAHARGLVHRDFKPDNVLVGRDGRVLVTDFGLARALGRADLDSASPSPSPPTPTLTQSGAVLGTPGYMAPEQDRGQEADARSDQYSFCVALYEGLLGARPGQPLPEPRREVPARLEQILARGLAEDPQQRFPSMDALLDELALDPRVRRRRILAVAGIALAVLASLGTSGLFVVRSLALGRACAGGAARFTKGLAPERRARLQALADRARSGGDALAVEASSRWTRLLGLLDDYRRDWIAGYTDACEATRVRRDQSEDLLNLRMSCLDARLPAVDVLGGLLEKDDPEVTRRLVTRQVLEPLAPCADRVALQAPLRPPSDESARKRVEALRARVERVTALTLAGEYKTAEVENEPLVAEARSIGYAPLSAEAFYARAYLEDRTSHLPAAERDYTEAALVGVGARHDLVVARARVQLVYLVGRVADRPAEGQELAREAEAAIRRMGGDRALEEALLDMRATLAMQQDHTSEARALYEREIAVFEKSAPKSYPLGRAENNLGVLEMGLGHKDEAAKHFARAMAIEEPLLGAHHPDILSLIFNRLITFDLPPIDETHDLVDRLTAVWGPSHVETASGLQLYANALLGDPKRRAEAPAIDARALAIFQRALPEDHDDVVTAHEYLGEALLRAARFSEAEVELRKCLTVSEKRPGPNHLILREALHLHGAALLGEGHVAEARRELERANAIPVEDPRPKGAVEFALARALAAGHELGHARELGRAAVADLEKRSFPDDEELSNARAWVAAHK
jgi:eukaryotic-like serine/threonine-protein kinase